MQHEEATHTQAVDHAREIVVDTVLPGQIFGWTALVGTGNHAVTAKCTKTTRVYALSATQLHDMITNDPSLGYFLYKRLSEIISKRLNARTNRLLEAWGKAFGTSKITPLYTNPCYCC